MKQVESDFELPRLSEGSDPVLSRALSGLRAHRPDVTELASLASQLAVRGIPVTSPGLAPSPASAAWKKWALAGGGAASGLALWWSLREPPPPPLISPRESPIEVSPPAVGESERPQSRARSAPRAGGAALAAPAVSTVAPEAPPEAGLPEAAAPTSVAPVPAARPVPNAVKPEADAPRAAAAPRPPSGQVTDRPMTPEASGAVAVPTEIELLRDARLALKSSPARALALAESHAGSYPNGKLTQERELIAISALAALGRRTAALSRASRFERAFPQSPYRKQISDLLQ